MYCSKEGGKTNNQNTLITVIFNLLSRLFLKDRSFDQIQIIGI